MVMVGWLLLQISARAYECCRRAAAVLVSKANLRRCLLHSNIGKIKLIQFLFSLIPLHATGSNKEWFPAWEIPSVALRVKVVGFALWGISNLSSLGYVGLSSEQVQGYQALVGSCQHRTSWSLNEDKSISLLGFPFDETLPRES